VVYEYIPVSDSGSICVRSARNKHICKETGWLDPCRVYVFVSHSLGFVPFGCETLERFGPKYVCVWRI
jgi:hypothetical protein